jgi:thiol-disulfide isomerase/thioredoxin
MTPRNAASPMPETSRVHRESLHRIHPFSHLTAMKSILRIATPVILLTLTFATVLRAQPAPPFVVESLDDSGSYFANESFAGKIVLVDFWATWCPPCVEALPELEKMYEEFHPQGFEILSLSFDASDERIRRFRDKLFAMPWKHGRLAGGFNDVVSLSFGLQNIPHYVLIDREGMIVAEGDDVHGERLRGLLLDYAE